jgi:glycosyltransferase involved in cell wall biosynthesis
MISATSITPDKARRIAFVLPGLHCINRGAETAFENLAAELESRHNREVTLFGGGWNRSDEPYRFCHTALISRDSFNRWPQVPVLRDMHRYEELTFLPALWRSYDPARYDLTVTCSYPFINWFLRTRRNGTRPAHVFVTQNGDWPAQRRNSEYRLFSCDGLVCTNPEFYARNKSQWQSVLIPNGVDTCRFTPSHRQLSPASGKEQRVRILMVSALDACKRVDEGIRAAAALPDCELFVAGGGPLAGELRELGTSLLGDRFECREVPAAEMPAIYQSADVLLHMSTGEAFGNVYIEALATGLPVVAHKCGVTDWIIGDSGVLVDTTNTSEVTLGLHRAFHSRSGIATSARAATCHTRFSWQSVATHYAHFFDQVCAEESAVAS